MQINVDFNANSEFVIPPSNLGDGPPLGDGEPVEDGGGPRDEASGGWSDFDITSDWGTIDASWDNPADADIQQVVIVGEKMTLWEKFEYDLENGPGYDLTEFNNYLGATIDSAFATFEERGYISVGWAAGVGVAITMDQTNHDIYISVTTGAGPIVAAGLTPAGMAQSDFLSGWSGSMVTGVGVGVVEASGTYQPVFGTPGMSVAWTVNATQELTNDVYDVLIGAHQYYNKTFFPDY